MYVKRVDAQTSIEVLCAALAVQKVYLMKPLLGLPSVTGMPDKDEERKFAVAVQQLKC